jgi:hypothetical protein
MSGMIPAGETPALRRNAHRSAAILAASAREIRS